MNWSKCTWLHSTNSYFFVLLWGLELLIMELSGIIRTFLLVSVSSQYSCVPWHQVWEKDPRPPYRWHYWRPDGKPLWGFPQTVLSGGLPAHTYRYCNSSAADVYTEEQLHSKHNPTIDITTWRNSRFMLISACLYLYNHLNTTHNTSRCFCMW